MRKTEGGNKRRNIEGVKRKGCINSVIVFLASISSEFFQLSVFHFPPSEFLIPPFISAFRLPHSVFRIPPLLLTSLLSFTTVWWQ